MQFSFFIVKAEEGSALRKVFHDDACPADPVGIKRMQGLTGLMQNIVGNVHNVADGSDADGFQPFRHP